MLNRAWELFPDIRPYFHLDDAAESGRAESIRWVYEHCREGDNVEDRSAIARALRHGPSPYRPFLSHPLTPLGHDHVINEIVEPFPDSEPFKSYREDLLPAALEGGSLSGLQRLHAVEPITAAEFGSSWRDAPDDHRWYHDPVGSDSHQPT